MFLNKKNDRVNDLPTLMALATNRLTFFNMMYGDNPSIPPMLYCSGCHFIIFNLFLRILIWKILMYKINEGPAASFFEESAAFFLACLYFLFFN